LLLVGWHFQAKGWQRIRCRRQTNTRPALATSRPPANPTWYSTGHKPTRELCARFADRCDNRHP